MMIEPDNRAEKMKQRPPNPGAILSLTKMAEAASFFLSNDKFMTIPFPNYDKNFVETEKMVDTDPASEYNARH